MKPMKEPKLKGSAYPQDDEDSQQVKLLGNDEDWHLPVKKAKDFDLNAFPVEIECTDETPETRSKSPPQTLKNDVAALATDPNKGMVFVRTPRLNFPYLHNGSVTNCCHLHYGSVTKFAPLYEGKVTQLVHEANEGGKLGIYRPLIVEKQPAVSHGNLYPLMRLKVQRQPYALHTTRPFSVGAVRTGFDYTIDYTRRCGEQEEAIPNCFITSSTGSCNHHCLQKLEPVRGKINKVCVYVENSKRCPHGSACPFLHDERPFQWQYAAESSTGKRKKFSDNYNAKGKGKGRDRGRFI